MSLFSLQAFHGAWDGTAPPGKSPLLLPLIAQLVAATFTALSAGAAPADRANRITPVVRCASRVLPSVVYLSADRLLPSGGEAAQIRPSDTTAAQPRTMPGFSLGSGVIIAPEGLVLTNAHVIQGAQRIMVTLNNGDRRWADVVASDDFNDLALLRIRGLTAPLPAIDLAEPGDLMLGETVVIVGNPYGLGGTIVEGVLSAVNRQVSYAGMLVFDDLLQTDAPMNPGHSGAPLININGEVIGLVIANLQDAPGISFAIPAQRLSDLIGLWLIPERFNDVSLGIVPAVRRSPDGDLIFYLQDVLPNSPADKSGLYPGMEITHVNGNILDHSILQISEELWKMRPGDSVEIMGDMRKYTVTAEKFEDDDWKELAELKLGLRVMELTEAMSEALGYQLEKGVIVSDLPSGNGGIKRGDVLIQLGDAAIASPDDLTRALHGIRYGQDVEAVFLEPTKTDSGVELRRKNTVLSVNRQHQAE